MRWAARLYRHAVLTLRPKVRRRRAGLRVQSLEPREMPHITGMAFLDFNQDGAQDPDEPGVAGVTVQATDAAGAVTKVQTGQDGSYTLETDVAVRLEFLDLPADIRPGRVTGDSGATVRFVDGSTAPTDVNLSLSVPLLAATQFNYDSAIDGANTAAPAVVAIPYGVADTPTPVVLATMGDVGTTWGLAYQASSDSLFTSAFLKRHAGFGPGANGNPTSGGIWRIDRATGDITLLVDLNTAGTGFSAGADPHPTTPESEGGDWFHDAATFGLVGKRGLGGLALSADGRTLYTINLNTRQLIEIPLNADGTRNDADPIRGTTIPLTNPAGSGITNFNANDLRPFAVSVGPDGTVYVGVTYTAETSGNAADLRAFVYTFTPAAVGTFSPAPVLTANLSYTRGIADPGSDSAGDEVSANWKAWSGDFGDVIGQTEFPVMPQPWLTDIAFDGTGMVLGIRDRFGDQSGFQTGNTTPDADPTDDPQFTGIAVGDILRAAANGSGGFELESNGAVGGVNTGGAGNTQGPGGGEFYFQDGADPAPQDATSGGLAQVPGFTSIAAAGSDALSPFTGGVYVFKHADGTVKAKAQLVETFDLSTFGSANAVGDLAVAPAADIQAGDRVFLDTDDDGIQDAGEAGLGGVTVRLFQGGNAVDSVITGAGGDFLFDDLLPNTAYEIRIDTAQAAIGGKVLAKANQGTNDTIDSDATLAGTAATLAFTTGADGTVVHALDIGFTGVTAQAGVLTLGNQVFGDVDGNGALNGTETGIQGVVVELLDAAGTTVLNTATTNASGNYTFTALDPGDYRVRLAASNFIGSGVLVGYTPSTPLPADPDNNVDHDNNGALSGGALGSGGFIVSEAITLADDTEPIDDGDTDANTNMTLDIGVVAPATTGLTLGNIVFGDTDNSSTMNGAETGIPGVAVQLLDATGATVITSTTTNASGQYTFTGLSAGDYIVQLASSNFVTGGPLAGFTPSSTSVDPDNNVNNDNNGSANGGTIRSDPITLTDNGEPINDGDTDPNTNLTLDFGVVQPAGSGTLSLGNQVFNDANNNGTRDAGETGVQGVTVKLYAASDLTTAIATTTTDAQGLYVFKNLAPGDYIVELADVNFLAGGVLVGFQSSTGTNNAFEGGNTPDPDTVATDGDDNGTTNGTLGQAGASIRSAAVTLAAGAEPTAENPNNDTATPDADSNLTVDFGVTQVAQPNTLSLGDRVFRDNNNNGTFDTGETGVAGVTVQLLDNQGTVLRSTVTDSAGLYRFINLAAGDYRVRLPASNFQTGGALVGFTSSTGGTNQFEPAPDPDNNINNNDDGTTSGTLGQANGLIESGLITLALDTEPTNDGDNNNDTNLTVDFGLRAPAVSLTLGNTVFNDANNNGLLDAGESGIAGVTVQLISATGTVLQTTTTNSSGQYTFTGLAAGDYRVRLASSNFSGTGPLVGFTSSTGMPGSANGPFEGSGTPDPDSNVNNDDNGQVSGTLGGSGFIETGLVTLTAGAEPTTDGDTDPNTNLTVDLGVFQRFSVGNVVFNDLNNNGTQDAGEAGINGVTVRLLDGGAGNTLVATTTTNAQGQYLFSNLAAGSYIVELAASNFNTGGVLFSFQSSTGTANAFEPAPVNTTDKNDNGTTSGTLGSGGVIQSGSITLGPGMPTGESPSNDLNTPDGQSDLTVDFGVFQVTPATASIAGRVFLDFNNSGTFNSPDTGIQGVTITLSGGNLSAPLTVQTDAQGNFSFTNLAAGTYTLTETQPTTPANQTGKDKAGTAGGTLTSPNVIGSINLGANQQGTGYTFAEVPLVSTGGSVYEDLNGNGQRDSGEAGIAGVTITLTGTSVVTGTITPRTVTTDTNGNYSFTNLTPGTYSIAETQPTGFIDGKEQNGTPAAATVTNDTFSGINLTNSAAASTGFNFGEIKAGGIAGVVFDDTSGNGAQDTGEVGIAGVTIKLTGTNDKGQAVNMTTTTAANGAYSFTNLRPGTYKLTETQKAGFKDGAETPGTAGGTTTVNDQISGIVLDSGESATGYLFAEQSAADLAITVTPGSVTVAPGGTVVLTFTVRNKGTVTAAAAEATLNLGSLTFVSADSPDYDNTTKKWTIGDLAAGDLATIKITVRAATAGSFMASANATTTTPELSTANNIAKANIFAGVSAPAPAPSFAPSNLWILTSFYPNLRRVGR